MSKLKPLTLNQNQVKRMLAAPVLSGFLTIRLDNNESEKCFQVIEFRVSDAGDILNTDGSPLVFMCEDGEKITYRVEAQHDEAIRRLVDAAH